MENYRRLCGRYTSSPNIIVQFFFQPKSKVSRNYMEISFSKTKTSFLAETSPCSISVNPSSASLNCDAPNTPRTRKAYERLRRVRRRRCQRCRCSRRWRSVESMVMSATTVWSESEEPKMARGALQQTPMPAKGTKYMRKSKK